MAVVFKNDRTIHIYSKPQLNNEERYQLNYEKLQQLIAIEGLKEDIEHESTAEAHASFMKKYNSIFIKPERSKLPSLALTQPKQYKHLSIPSNKSTGPTLARSLSSNSSALTDNNAQNEISHDIRDYTKLLRKQRKDEADNALKVDGIKMLRRMLRKLPFQRTAEDVDVMYKILKTFPNFCSLVPKELLRELCYVAQLDQWSDEDFPVFGSSGMHMILKGSVTTQTFPHLYDPNQSLQDFRRSYSSLKRSASSAQSTSKPQVLQAGECFGTFITFDGQTMHKKMFMVNTREPNCEFLKITTSDYTRVLEQIKMKEQTKKLNLIQNCASFKSWTRQPMLKLANLIEWCKYAPNTVIVSEGYKAPFIGLVQSGECHVLKKLEVMEELPNGEKECRVRQVVMGKIGADQTFAELSVLREEPMNCSIITASHVQLGTISANGLFGLDETTLHLLNQSCHPTFDNITQDKIHEEYMDQELKREWNQYRHNAVIEAINAQGIRPGFGKWKKN